MTSKSFQKKPFRFLLCIFFGFFLIFNFFFYPFTAQAVMYAPGATLEPACAPTDTNCGVTSTSDITLNTGKIFVGDGSNLAAGVTLSGDGSITTAGIFSISDNAVTTSKIVDGAVTYDKLQTVGTSKLLGNSSSTAETTAEEITIGNGLAFSGTDLGIYSPTCASNQRLSWSGTAFECKAGGVFGEIVAANQFLLGPISGSATNPTFRALNTADLGSGTANNQAVLLGDLSWFDLFDGSGKINTSALPSSITGSLKFKGTWNANTNTPTLSGTGGGGDSGDFYIVDVASTTMSLDGHVGWVVGDWVVNNGSTWDKVAQGVTVDSVNGQTGTVSLTTSNISEGTGLYFTNVRAREAFTGVNAISISTSTGAIDCPSCVLATTTNGNLIAGAGFDLTGTLSDRLIGTGDVTFALSNTPVTVGSYGDSTSVTTFTVDALGRVMAAGTTTLDVAAISSGNLSVARGGTGAGTFTANGVLYGSTTNALMATAAGTSGQILVANASGVPTFVSASGDITIDSAGVTTIGTGKITSTKILDGTIANADIASDAAVAYSKLNLTGAILNADLAGSIANNKLANSTIALSLGTSGTDANVSGSPASLGGTLTLNLPDASATNRGLVTTGAQTFSGTKTFSDTLAVTGTSTLSGQFSTPRGADYSTTGTQNNVNLGSGSYFHYTGNGNATFTGIAGGTDGRLIRLLNDTEDYTLTIKDRSTDSEASNRIETPNGEDVVLQPELMMALIYESDSQVWHLASIPATINTVKSFSYVNGGNAFAATSSIGTTDAYGINFITGGTTRFSLASHEAKLTGTGATTFTSHSGDALTIDSGTTGALNLGTGSDAKTITIGNTTGATTLNLNAGSGGINLLGNVTLLNGSTFTTGTGLVIDNSSALRLTANDTVIDMTGTGALGLNTTTNRAITTGTGLFTTGGDLKINGDDLFMNTNTSGYLLVADGTNFNPVALSGDATISSTGALTLNYSGAQHADTTHTGFLNYTDWNTFNNKQSALGFTAENVANKSIDTTLSSNSDSLYPSQKAVKTYVDSRVSGLNWLQPVEIINVVGTTSTAVGSPVNLDVYILESGIDSGDWNGAVAGDMVQYQTDHWEFIKHLAVGDRFGVAFKSNTTPTGAFSTKKNYVITITGGTASAFTYDTATAAAPAGNDSLFVQNTNAYYHNVAFTYSNTLVQWVQMSATVDWQMGSGLQANGNTASLGNLTANWTQSGAFDITTAGSLSIASTTTMRGNVVMPKGTDYSANGTQNNVNLGNGSLFNYTGDGVTISGFAGGADGRFIRVINATSSGNIVLKHQSTDSLAANRIIIETGADVTILPNSSFELSYDSGASRWRVVVLPANTALVTGGNSYASDIRAGTTDNYGLNFITNNTTRFSIDKAGATMTGTGATTLTTNNTLNLSSASGYNLSAISGTTGDLILDSGSTGAINIGTSTNAKTITIGNTTGATALNLKAGSAGITLTGSTTLSSALVTFAGNSTVLDMSGTGVLSLNTTTNRPITTGSGVLTAGGDLIVTGVATTTGSLVALGNYVTPKGTDYTTTGSQNNVDLGAGSLFRYSGSGVATFTGIAGGLDGRQIHIMNVSSSNLTINSQDTSSTDINRVITSSGSAVTVPPATTIALQYDAGVSRWRVLTITLTQTSVSGFAYINGGNSFGATASFGTNDVYGLEFKSGGSTRFSLDSSASTLTGSGATTLAGGTTLALTSAAGSALTVTSGTTGAITIDSGSTGAVNLGTGNNAKTISIGTGTAGNTINIGSDNTTADTLNIGSALDALTLSSTGLNVSSSGALTGVASISSSGAISTSGNISTTGSGTITSAGLLTGSAGITVSGGTASINTTGTSNTSIGNTTGTLALTSNGGLNVTTAGALTGVASIDTITTSATAIGFAGAGTISTTNGTFNLNTGTGALNVGTDAVAKTITFGNTTGATSLTLNSGTGGITLLTGTTGAVSIKSGTTGSVTLDSGTTGTVNIGNGNNAKTINIGTGTAGNTINIGSDNTTADTITAGSALDTMTIGAGTLNITNPGAQSNGSTVLCIQANRVRLGASNTSCQTSSARFKHDITDLDLGLETINALRPVGYYYNDNNAYNTGLLAEDVYKYIPSAVTLDAEGLPYALDYNNITPVIIKAIKEQSVLMGDISPKASSTDNGLATLLDTTKAEIARDPSVVIGQKIADGKQFLTDFVALRVTAVRGYFDEIFTKKVHTEKLCVKKSDGTEVCVDGDQIQNLIDKNNVSTTAVTSSPAPESVVTPTETTPTETPTTETPAPAPEPTPEPVPTPVSEPTPVSVDAPQ